MDRICNPSTHIVIEAYPRSANTYSVAYFRYVGKDKYVIASHQHAVAQIILARKYNIPALVIIRAPIDSILSLKIRRPDICVDALVREYINFYRDVLLFKESLVIARFESVIGDMKQVVKKINTKFKKDFPLRDMEDHDRLEINRIIDQMDEDDRKIHGEISGPSKETHVGRPIEERKKNPKFDFYKTEIQHSKYLESAIDVYKNIYDYADV